MPGGNAHLAVVDQAKNNLKKLETYISTGMDNTLDMALDLVEHDKEKSEPRLVELRKVMLEYSRMERELTQFLEATESVKQQAKRSDTEEDLEALLDQKLKALRDNTKGNDLKDHEKYVDMEKRIEDLMQTDDGASAVEKEPTQIDDDIAMTQLEIVTKCPYTGSDMKEPVKNKHCGHNYEREGIERAMKLRKGKTKCPVPGCVNEKIISADDLEDNKTLRRHIENKTRQQSRRNKKT